MLSFLTLVNEIKKKKEFILSLFIVTMCQLKTTFPHKTLYSLNEGTLLKEMRTFWLTRTECSNIEF